MTYKVYLKGNLDHPIDVAAEELHVVVAQDGSGNAGAVYCKFLNTNKNTVAILPFDAVAYVVLG